MAANGFLRWAYDAWPADPVRDARHVLWPAGDCFMVYPGAERSIRFEKMREGIVDFEKLRILQSKASKSGDPVVKKQVEELKLLLGSIAIERGLKKEKLETELEKGKRLIDALSNRLSTSTR